MAELKQEHAPMQVLYRSIQTKNEAASSKAMTELHLITAVTYSKQRRDIMTADIPNIFVQTTIENKSNKEQTIMKIREQLVDMLIDISPEDHQDFV
jgi:hypothetical protein